MKSNLDLVNECDVFPYPDKDPKAHSALLNTLYTLVSQDGTPIGYLLEPIFNALVKVPIRVKGELEVSRSRRTVCAFNPPPTNTPAWVPPTTTPAPPADPLPPSATEEQRSKLVAATIAYWRENKTFKVLEGWRDELYPVYGPANELLFNVERSASTLFGVVTYGVHMTGFVRDEEANFGIKIWVPRRAKNKQTYGDMLDNTVAGGMATGEEPLECLVREADEEASLPEELVRKNAKACGTITYIYIRSSRAGGESGMIQPECQYVYDLELPPSVIPKPNDSEVQEFYLWTVEEVQAAMGRGEFKPNCALLMLDFFIRHGILTEENEKDYAEIKKRLHRELEFPGMHRI